MLENKYNAKEKEEKWMNYWSSKNVYAFDPNSKKEVFSMDTPPPTVSGKIHIGHVFSYTQAEIIARFNRLKGLNVFYPFGFDDNGLPTERLVEREAGVKAKTMQREKFINLCLETTEKYEKDFENLYKRLGFSSDWSLKYSSIDERSRRVSQRSFIELAKNGDAYYTTDPVLWCTECETGVAQAETESKEVESTFNHLKFETIKTDEHEAEEFIVATTRPEFLPSCVAIFIHPKDEKNAHLVGQKAKVPLFDFEVPIIADDLVELGKGSGIVMCCTFGDTTDIEWWKKYKLPLKELFTDEGVVKVDTPLIGGHEVKVARTKILELLKEADKIVKIEQISHDVNVHERCGHEIEFKVKNGWFIKTLDIKEELLEYGNKIAWHPAHMQARYNDWVNNLAWDWGISRQRFYGVSFPVWYCNDCGEIIFGKDENLPIDPVNDQPDDGCPKCGSHNLLPETDIMDTWATSSVSQLVNMKWGEKDSLIDKLAPMSLRPNAHDIIRTWDFYSIVKNYYHLKQIPWENLMISGFVMASKGQKISKSKNNSSLEPREAIDKYTTDVVRYWAASGRLGTDLAISEDTFKVGTKLMNKIYNASKLVIMNLDGYEDKEFNDYEIIDNWLINKYNSMTIQYNDYLEKYEVGLAMSVLEKFFWNFCDNYLEIVKHRLYNKDVFGDKAHYSGQKTIFTVLYGLLQKFSVFFPFITEEIYQEYYKEFKGNESIHTSEYEILDNGLDKEAVGDLIVRLNSVLRGHKTEAGVSLKTEITELAISIQSEYLIDLKAAEKDIKAAATIKKLTINPTNDIKDFKIDNIVIPVTKIIDKEAELEKLRTKKESLESGITNAEKMLANENFVSRAPEHVVTEAKSNVKQYKAELEEIEAKIASL